MIALIGAKPVPPATNMIGFVGLLAQIERAERPLETEDLASLVLGEQRVGEKAVGNVADVQLEQLVVVRRRGQRKAAALAVLQQEVDVLPREILQALVGRQLDPDDRDVGRDLLDRLDAAWQALDLDVAGAPHFAHFDDEVGLRRGAAEERQARALLVFGQRRLLVRAVVDAAGEDPALAGAAGAVAAAVRQHEIGTHRRREHGLAVVARERVLAGLYGNLERHCVLRSFARCCVATSRVGKRDQGPVDRLR